jgi:diaminohydroxyphosphoribosylaminopyrimidine deaminase/5-amino-6-(5-phosphoribosylamino)uracil reductase
MYVTLEPCAHHGSTPPCADAVISAGVTRVVTGAADPNPITDGRGFAKLREGGIDVELAEGELGWRARVQNEAWRTWIRLGRPFVTLKMATSLDGRVTVPGRRWVTGEESRRRVHELRAASDAVAVGMGTVHADRPQLTARNVDAPRQPRRLAFGRGPLPQGSDLELLTGPIESALRRLGEEGVQSLLLEGGPTLATSFLRADLVDKLVLFIAPTLAGEGPTMLVGAVGVLSVYGMEYRSSGDDLLLTSYVHEP